MKGVVGWMICVAAVCGAVPLNEAFDAKTSFELAVDVSAQTNSQTFNCYRTSHYKTAFIRIYQSDNYGSIDPNGPTNILNADNAGLGIEVFVTPNVTLSGDNVTPVKQGYQQLDEAYTNVVNSGITIKSVWLQVTSPRDWSNNQYTNANFINSFLQRAAQRGLGMGIYTNWYDWKQITDNWAGWMKLGTVNLWYWHVTGMGQSGETSANFDDFTSFSDFTTKQAAVKQFGQNIQISTCPGYVNLNAYPGSMKKSFLTAKQESKQFGKDNKIVVGKLFMNQ